MPIISPSPAASVLLFDGVCYLCTGLVQYILRHDPDQKIRFASLQSAAGQALLQQQNLPAQGPSAMETVVFFHRNQVYTKADAAMMVLKELGSWHTLLANALRVVPAFLRNKLYTLVAQNRYRLLGKRSTCLLTPANLQDRFLPGG